MTPKELEQVIREYLRDIFKIEYIDKLKVFQPEFGGYCIEFYKGVDNAPQVIYVDLEGPKLISFIKEQIKHMGLHNSGYAGIQLVNPTRCTPIDKSCNCHDKRRND